MTRRVVVGKRANGQMGIFVSPAGIDAYTASDAQLILNISERIQQLLMLGWVDSSTTVAMGLTRTPIVVLTSLAEITSVPGFEGMRGPMRPSPSMLGTTGGVLNSASSVVINANGASMSITAPQRTNFAVYNSPLT